jgi:hypothetical protein
MSNDFFSGCQRGTDLCSVAAVSVANGLFVQVKEEQFTSSRLERVQEHEASCRVARAESC